MLGASNYVTQSRIHALEISIPEKLSQRYWILYLIHMLALQLEPEKYFVHGLMTVEPCNRSKIDQSGLIYQNGIISMYHRRFTVVTKQVTACSILSESQRATLINRAQTVDLSLKLQRQ